MHKPLTPKDRCNMLADYIEQHTEEHFTMGSSSHCAYAFAKHCFGIDHIEAGGVANSEALARMLHISDLEARALYHNTHMSRQDAVQYIRSLAQRVA